MSIYKNFLTATQAQRDMTLSGASTTHALRLEITDDTTLASGYARGGFINITGAGTKTGSGEVNGLGIDVAITGDTPYAYNLALYCSESGNPTIGFKAALSIYVDTLGTGVGALCAIDVGIAKGTNSPSGRDTYMRFRSHTTNDPASLFLLEGGVTATYLIDTSISIEPVAVNTGSMPGTCTHVVKCRHLGTTFYLVGTALPT